MDTGWLSYKNESGGTHTFSIYTWRYGGLAGHDGWDYFEQLIAWHRAWLADLPEAVRRKISVENARQLFGRE